MNARGVCLRVAPDSDLTIAPELSITSNNNTPVVHDDHAPTLPVKEDALNTYTPRGFERHF